MAADNLDGVLVGAYGTVAAESVEFALGGAGLDDGNLCLYGKRLEGYIIYDTDCKVVLGLFQLKIVVNCDNLCRRGVF